MKNLYDIATRLNALSEDKQIQFRQVLAQKGIDSWALPIVATPNTDNTPQPLSAAQQRLWFIDRYEQGSSLYNLCSVLRLRGVLDLEKLQQALAVILQRHEVLRSVYGEQDGLAFQTIRDADTFTFKVESLEDELGFQQNFDQWLATCYRQAQQQIFDLSTELPFRANLIRIADDDHLLVFTVHHIAFDAWSQEAIIRELSLLYASSLEQMHSALAPLPVQYRDYARWQKQWLAGDDYQKQLDYWCEKLAKAPECLSLPLDKPRRQRNEQRHLGREIRLPLSADLSEQLRVQAKAHNVSIYQYLLTVFTLVLHYYSDSDDIVIGTSVANRQRPELEALAGLFVNTLVLRTQLSAQMNFAELLSAVSKTSQEAVSHQDIPFDHLLDALDVARSDTHSPLFQVLFVYLNMPDQQALALGDLRVDILPYNQQQARFDLSLRVEEQASDGLCLCMEYDTDLFYASTIEQMLSDYHLLCVRLCARLCAVALPG
ncbi:MAG: non-ribosomal peptide synthetase, partial [Alteromonadaceae bacterium]